MALLQSPKALLFDAFGICVDWRRTVTNSLYAHAHASLNSATASVVNSWRNSYKKFTKSVANDPALPWKTVDGHHLETLEQLLSEWNLDGLWIDDEVRMMSLIWHRLEPWPDSAPGIKVLNKLPYTVTLSNGNLSLLSDLKSYGSMDFTRTFSAEQFESYKPSPSVYLGEVEKLGLKPPECAMVAAHLTYLKAAKSHGLQAIYIERSLEEDWSSEEIEVAKTEGRVDLWIPIDQAGFMTVAESLGVDIASHMVFLRLK
ncbi:haloacid dehalogenase [Lindgomyces ingoldianus]|uniref:Haloacid dehalogenase n=1 Tax=Lindgomyces ingoldianus TaxID=673940 RepID=A0ACB6RG92_9PLEO|nr:haloacid dehalogenase [Lindgomyces ingoldianus]KAF2477788.1 haloacid dehalogenase [Lindgomyces ingoldianus]